MFKIGSSECFHQELTRIRKDTYWESKSNCPKLESKQIKKAPCGAFFNIINFD
jgi:hypothetical protein